MKGLNQLGQANLPAWTALGRSAPVVEDVEAGAAVSRFVGPVHGDDQGLGAKTARHHLQIGLLAGEIDPGEEVRHPDRRGERAAAVEERGKVRGGPSSWPHGAEFDVTAALAGLAGRSPMAYRKSGEVARALPQQQGVAEAARRDGADFRAEIEAVIERVGQLPTCRLDTTPIVFGQRAIARPGPGIAAGPGGHRHNRGQKPRAKPEFAIECEVQRTLRKGAQPRVPDTPILELVADRFDQSLAATAPLPLRTHRIGPEKAEATPADREIGADQLAVQLGRKARDVLGPEAAIDVVAIRPEILRIARAQESPESGAENAPRPWQIISGQWPDQNPRYFAIHLI